ncbi:hypothetical protein J6590_026379 [Homalodisca vitripennis]|nr:hypothetical protein J6590_026379 [Homalodisca vitripennis]
MVQVRVPVTVTAKRVRVVSIRNGGNRVSYRKYLYSQTDLVQNISYSSLDVNSCHSSDDSCMTTRQDEDAVVCRQESMLCGIAARLRYQRGNFECTGLLVVYHTKRTDVDESDGRREQESMLCGIAARLRYQRGNFECTGLLVVYLTKRTDVDESDGRREQESMLCGIAARLRYQRGNFEYTGLLVVYLTKRTDVDESDGRRALMYDYTQESMLCGIAARLRYQRGNFECTGLLVVYHTKRTDVDESDGRRECDSCMTTRQDEDAVVCRTRLRYQRGNFECTGILVVYHTKRTDVDESDGEGRDSCMTTCQDEDAVVCRQESMLCGIPARLRYQRGNFECTGILVVYHTKRTDVDESDGEGRDSCMTTRQDEDAVVCKQESMLCGIAARLRYQRGNFECTGLLVVYHTKRTDVDESDGRRE